MDVVRIRIATFALGFAWTLVLVASLFWNQAGMQGRVREIGRSQALAHFERTKAIHAWNWQNGGVYVPVSDQTQPNPALRDVPDRDILAPGGKVLTLVNPAYMIRKIDQANPESLWISSHMTSLKPLRQENKAVGWEREALLQLENGSQEIVESLKDENGVQAVHFMRPLRIKEACKKCHLDPGFQVGEIGGGIAVTVSQGQLQRSVAHRWRTVLVTHLLIWVVGLVLLGSGSLLLIRGLKKSFSIAKDLEESFASTEAVLDGLPMGVVLVGRDRKIRKINRTALEILEKSEGDVVGKICHQNICPAQEGKCPILDLNQRVDNSEKIVLGPNGKPIPVLKSVIPFNYKGEEVLLEAFIDISDRKTTIQRLTNSMAELQRFNRLAVERELRMVELKSEINQLLEVQGQEARYVVVGNPGSEGRK